MWIAAARIDGRLYPAGIRGEEKAEILGGEFKREEGTAGSGRGSVKDENSTKAVWDVTTRITISSLNITRSPYSSVLPFSLPLCSFFLEPECSSQVLLAPLVSTPHCPCPFKSLTAQPAGARRLGEAVFLLRL